MSKNIIVVVDNYFEIEGRNLGTKRISNFLSCSKCHVRQLQNAHIGNGHDKINVLISPLKQTLIFLFD